MQKKIEITFNTIKYSLLLIFILLFVSSISFYSFIMLMTIFLISSIELNIKEIEDGRDDVYLCGFRIIKKDKTDKDKTDENSK